MRHLTTVLFCAAMLPLVKSITVYFTPDSQNYTCTGIQEPCYTLSQYSANTMQDSNTTFIFLPGNHHLSYQLTVAVVHRLTLIALDINVTVTCSQRGKVVFETIQQVSIDGITFIGCNGNRIISIASLYIEDSNFHEQDRIHSALELVGVDAVIVGSSFSAKITDSETLAILSGGALMITRSNVSIINSSFIHNSAYSGGAIQATLGSNLLIDNSIFESNRATQGAAIHVSSDCFISVLNCSFSSNRGTYGGAMSIEHSKANIAWSTFSNNSAWGDYMWSQYGGALYCVRYATVSIDGGIVTKNRATIGGGLYADDHCNISVGEGSLISNNYANNGGGIYSSRHCTVSIAGTSAIFNNHAIYGGGLYCYWNFVSVNQSFFTSNNATYGGGVYGYRCAISLSDSSFSSNSTLLDGGGVYVQSDLITVQDTSFTNNGAVYGRGAIHSYGHLVRLVHSTLHNNTAAQYGGLRATMLEIRQGKFVNNTATGVDERDGGGVLCVRNGNVSIETSYFAYNTANEDGGVMEIDHSIVSLIASTFTNNIVHRSGGVGECDYCIISIENCVFNDNMARRYCGVLDINGHAEVIITHTNFSYNSAEGSSGVLSVDDFAVITITNTNFSSR